MSARRPVTIERHARIMRALARGPMSYHALELVLAPWSRGPELRLDLAVLVTAGRLQHVPPAGAYALAEHPADVARDLEHQSDHEED